MGSCGMGRAEGRLGWLARFNPVWFPCVSLLRDEMRYLDYPPSRISGGVVGDSEDELERDGGRESGGRWAMEKRYPFFRFQSLLARFLCGVFLVPASGGWGHDTLCCKEFKRSTSRGNPTSKR